MKEIGFFFFLLFFFFLFLCHFLPCSWAYRSEWARAERNGKAHTLPAQGIGAKSATQIHLKPLCSSRSGRGWRTHRVPVDALRFDLLSPAPLQRLIDAQDERPVRYDESFHEQPQQPAADFPTRPQEARLREPGGSDGSASLSPIPSRVRPN
jgi:hypothetical protein